MCKKCKWAGDPNDVACKSCNGLSFMFEGVEQEATECGGYEIDEKEVEEQQELQEPTESVEKIEKEIVQDTKDLQEIVKEEVEVIEKESLTLDIKNLITPKSITISSTITKEIRGTYYKLGYTQETQIKENVSYEELEEIKKYLWDVANNEVDKQIKDLL